MAIRNTWHFFTSGERESCGAIWHWLCLPRSSDIEGHIAAATTSTELGALTFSVTFLDIRNSQRSPL